MSIYIVIGTAMLFAPLFVGLTIMWKSIGPRGTLFMLTAAIMTAVWCNVATFMLFKGTTSPAKEGVTPCESSSPVHAPSQITK